MVVTCFKASSLLPEVAEANMCSLFVQGDATTGSDPFPSLY